MAAGRRVQVAAGLLAGVGACLCALLFASGFLLSRTELPNRSVCREQFAPSGGAGGCWLPRRYDRLVLLLVDALRFDFLRPPPAAAENRTGAAPQPPIWAANILAVDELQKSRPRHVFVAHVEADPPTTTLQRLKALLTGTLPTFIDASANFGGLELLEDNLIDQLIGTNRSAVFMGDDTWVGLLPGRFLRSHAFPSFNVHDLDTVDRGVERHLAEELKRSDWQVMIAHVLGVDHCGHRYGPDHPEMRRKLREVDGLLRTLVQSLDDRTLLAVVGDHGMTQSGDHGGGTLDESDAGLALVSNSRPLLSQDDALAMRERPARLSQIDLVPTLSLLLGAPVPFSSLGAVPPALFADGGDGGRAALDVNARQVLRFLDTYQAAYGDLPEDRLAALRAAASADATVDGLLRLLADAKSACRNVWTRFDEPAIRLALFAFAVCLAFGTAFSVGGGGGGGGGLLLGCFAAALATCAAARVSGEAAFAWFQPGMVSYLPAVALAVGVACLAIRLLLLWTADAPPPDTGARLSALTSVACACVCAFAALCPMSNSYIVAEPQCLQFLLQTLLLLQAAATAAAVLHRARADGLWRKPCKSLATHPCTLAAAVHAGTALCLRLSLGIVTCREEARTLGCRDTWLSAPATGATGDGGNNSWRLLGAILTLIAGLAAIRLWLRRCGSMNGHSAAVMTLTYLPAPIAMCAVMHWALQASVIGASTTALPRIGLALAGAGCLALLLAPVSAHLERPSETRLRAVATALSRGYGLADVAPTICRDLFGAGALVRGGSGGAVQPERPLAYGLACVYRTAYCGLLLLTALAALLLTGHRAVPAFVLFAAAALGRAELRSAQLRLGQGRPLGSLAGWPDLLYLQLLGWLGFYSMGLQPALSAIRWDPAFIFYNAETSGAGGRAAAALLITGGMFCCQFLASLAAPLLLLLLPLNAGWLPFALRPKWRRLLGGGGTSDGGCDSGDFFLAELPRGSLGRAAAGALCRQLLIAGCLALGCMGAAAWHRRHLMAWKVFAPRMMFGVLGCAASAVGAVLGGLLVAACLDRGVRRWAVRVLDLQEFDE